MMERLNEHRKNGTKPKLRKQIHQQGCQDESQKYEEEWSEGVNLAMEVLSLKNAVKKYRDEIDD